MITVSHEFINFAISSLNDFNQSLNISTLIQTSQNLSVDQFRQHEHNSLLNTNVIVSAEFIFLTITPYVTKLGNLIDLTRDNGFLSAQGESTIFSDRTLTSMRVNIIDKYQKDIKFFIDSTHKIKNFRSFLDNEIQQTNDQITSALTENFTSQDTSQIREFTGDNISPEEIVDNFFSGISNSLDNPDVLIQPIDPNKPLIVPNSNNQPSTGNNLFTNAALASYELKQKNHKFKKGLAIAAGTTVGTAVGVGAGIATVGPGAAAGPVAAGVIIGGILGGGIGFGTSAMGVFLRYVLDDLMELDEKDFKKAIKNHPLEMSIFNFSIGLTANIQTIGHIVDWAPEQIKNAACNGVLRTRPSNIANDILINQQQREEFITQTEETLEHLGNVGRFCRNLPIKGLEYLDEQK